jgi:hypothetical protein
LSNYSRKKQRKNEEARNHAVEPWISLKTGRRVIWFVSIAMALLTAWQVIPQKGIAEGIFWGFIFGGLIWLIFEGYYRLNRLLRRTR